MSEPLSPADAAAEAQRREYGVYVAIAPIAVEGVIGYYPGTPVPVSNVELHGWHDLVRRTDEPAPQVEQFHEDPPAPEGQTIDGDTY